MLKNKNNLILVWTKISGLGKTYSLYALYPPAPHNKICDGLKTISECILLATDKGYYTDLRDDVDNYKIIKMY